MTRTTKAVLMSLLLFPGSGLFLLQRYVSAVALSGAAAVALYMLLRAALVMAEAISEKILSGTVPLEPIAILNAVHSVAAASGPQANLASLVFMGCWVVGVVLSWRAGDANDHTP
ncbi:hypothetical protein [Motiliproteus sediminis]|uniref:hypothetical protein n=1 Tax=Motiliproteus sediminis TaxID=1468178 RepID=UPI001AEF799D|nr:hypothetical protein [Motiliproteus sediminis]